MLTKTKRTFSNFGRAVGKSVKRYGFKIIADIAITVGVILLVISLFFAGSNPSRTHILMLVALFFVLAGSIVGIIFDILILTSKINKRSPRYRSALVNFVVLAILFVVALVGIIITFAVVL